jgi:hypothetical protein
MGWRTLAAGLIAWLLIVQPVMANSGITPEHAALESVDDAVLLSARFNIQLGARLEDAVSRGIPLHFSLTFSLTRPRWYWLDDTIAHYQLDYRLDYQPLSRRYRLTIGRLSQTFATRQEALSVMSRIAHLRVAEKSQLVPDTPYVATVRLSLDQGYLPKPLQIDALANRDWQLDSPALTWTIENGNGGSR